MAKLIYTTIASLDGYVADADGKFGWAEPDEEVFRFVNELERPIGTYLFGRRMYEVMVYWETAHTAVGLPPVEREFAAIWRAASKIVYSRTLTQASSVRTTIEQEFDPEAVRRLKAEARQDITVGGPHLGAEALRAGLVDEYHLLIAPVIVGAGIAALPSDLRIGLDLLDERRFAGGMVHLHYRITPSSEP
jgi:dihydrofolate reductase